jgi:hypothetical protein
MTWRAPSLERVLEMTDDDEIACCNQCKQALTEIDCYGGEREWPMKWKLFVRVMWGAVCVFASPLALTPAEAQDCVWRGTAPFCSGECEPARCREGGHKRRLQLSDLYHRQEGLLLHWTRRSSAGELLSKRAKAGKASRVEGSLYAMRRCREEEYKVRQSRGREA